jgi:hypothetical protein
MGCPAFATSQASVPCPICHFYPPMRKPQALPVRMGAVTHICVGIHSLRRAGNEQHGRGQERGSGRGQGRRGQKLVIAGGRSPGGLGRTAG